MKQVSEELKTLLKFYPQIVSGETVVSGIAFDRKGYESAKFGIGCGYTANSPTNVQIEFGLQESDTESGTYAAVTISETTTITGENADIPGSYLEVNVDLKARKRWVKPTVTPTFTGGSSPTANVSVAVVLGEATIVPAV